MCRRCALRKPRRASSWREHPPAGSASRPRASCAMPRPTTGDGRSSSTFPPALFAWRPALAAPPRFPSAGAKGDACGAVPRAARLRPASSGAGFDATTAFDAERCGPSRGRPTPGRCCATCPESWSTASTSGARTASSSRSCSRRAIRGPAPPGPSMAWTSPTLPPSGRPSPIPTWTPSTRSPPARRRRDVRVRTPGVQVSLAFRAPGSASRPGPPTCGAPGEACSRRTFPTPCRGGPSSGAPPSA